MQELKLKRKNTYEKGEIINIRDQNHEKEVTLLNKILHKQECFLKFYLQENGAKVQLSNKLILRMKNLSNK